MTDNTTINTDGLKRISVQKYWDVEADTKKRAFLMIGDQPHVIDLICMSDSGADRFDIEIADDFDLRSVGAAELVIYVENAPKKTGEPE